MESQKRATLLLRGLPEWLVRKVKVRAAERGVTVGELVTEILSDSLDEPFIGKPPMAGERSWFEAHRDELERAYPGEFLAISQNQVVDHDLSFDSLARRFFASHGDYLRSPRT